MTRAYPGRRLQGIIISRGSMRRKLGCLVLHSRQEQSPTDQVRLTLPFETQLPGPLILHGLTEIILAESSWQIGYHTDSIQTKTIAPSPYLVNCIIGRLGRT